LIADMSQSIHELAGFVKPLICQTAPLPPLTFPVKKYNSITMSTLLTSLTVQQLRKAASLKEKIQSLEKELGRLLGSSTPSADPAVPRKKFKMSKAGESQRAKGIGETRPERQKENECGGQSQNLRQNETRLGPKKGRQVQITGSLGRGQVPLKETQIKSN
jgi:hypothetical protein